MAVSSINTRAESANTWGTAPLEDVVSFRSGIRNTDTATEGGNFPFFVCSSEVLRCDEFDFDDEAVVMAGNNADGVFHLHYFVGKFAARQRTYVITPRTKRLDCRWLFHQLEVLQPQFKAGAIGTTTRYVTIDMLRRAEIFLPDVRVQRAIVAALSDVDAVLGGLDRLIAKKRELKQATMQQLLSGQTRLPGFRGKRELKRLGEMAAVNRVNVVPALQPNSPFMHFSLPAFDAGQTAEIVLGSSIGSNKFGVPPTAVLVSKLNPRIPRIWAPRSVPKNAVASTEWLVLTPRDGIDRQYLFALCSSSAVCEQMELAATGTTGSHQRISPSTALDIRIHVAVDASEQIAIATVLSDLEAELSALEARRAKTRALKQGMMQELLTGRTRLVSPEIAHA